MNRLKMMWRTEMNRLVCRWTDCEESHSFAISTRDHSSAFERSLQFCPHTWLLQMPPGRVWKMAPFSGLTSLKSQAHAPCWPYCPV